MNIRHTENIRILNKWLHLNRSDPVTIDYCGISNTNDFHNYADIITFKYQVVNTKRQFSKLCDFITEYKQELDYDWYIKFRPDMKLLDPIDMDILKYNWSINLK
jgi:hypothetical protein